MNDDRLEKIEDETAEIKKQILELEFQHKKDIIEAEKRSNEWAERMEKSLVQMEKSLVQMRDNLHHINKLAGITFEKFDDIESRLKGASDALQPQAKQIK
ncbi:MAG: hypothetical protein M3405_17965 [Acidobacteriota bacterium]|jgi:uncharacterized protein YukE|nr:hypothetical protein [Acidobacteriota bacterium]